MYKTKTGENKIVTNELLAQKATALVEAASKAGTAAVRTTATVGGNLANASPAADLATPLLICDAEISLMSAEGTRAVPLDDFFKGPSQSVLQPEELMTEISFVIPKGKTTFLKLGRRKALTLSVVPGRSIGYPTLPPVWIEMRRAQP